MIPNPTNIPLFNGSTSSFSMSLMTNHKVQTLSRMLQGNMQELFLRGSSVTSLQNCEFCNSPWDKNPSQTSGKRNKVK
ncbi:hypothetical protein CICLE_v10013316mg [Citrus x clementina]|uniref:Uncharacterized protein n=1 Tax=Citrus clementina TaxID=85681 RepID=V4SN77_CITCL|nr:hypothetical protein CICLE_v10013316mg [Citrus x clementina]